MTTLEDIAQRLKDAGQYHRAVEVEVVRYRLRKLGARIQKFKLLEARHERARRCTYRVRYA